MRERNEPGRPHAHLPDDGGEYALVRTRIYFRRLVETGLSESSVSRANTGIVRRLHVGGTPDVVGRIEGTPSSARGLRNYNGSGRTAWSST